jgi:uncharacterized protein YdeI (YjbR/CyaY-like superfamily)
MKRPQTVDDYIRGMPHWQPEVRRLRDIILSTGLEETVKWGAPCYTWQGQNVVGVAAFKDYFGLWFHQGTFLRDEAGVLVRAQAKTRGLRQWRFDSAKDIKVALIRSYLKEAMELASQGKQIRPRRDRPVVVGDELQRALDKDPCAAEAFASLTRGRQREFAEFVAEAKQPQTRARRVARVLPLIKRGEGLNDRYRKGN